VTHRPLAAIVGQHVGTVAEQGRNFRLCGRRQQRLKSAKVVLGGLHHHYSRI